MFETQGEGKLLQDEGGDFWDFILPLELQATMPD
jgi:hypothetical protein